MNELLLYLDIFLVSRVFWVHSEDKVSYTKLIPIIIVPCIFLFFTQWASWKTLIFLLFIIPPLMKLRPRTKFSGFNLGLYSLLIALIVMLPLFSHGVSASASGFGQRITEGLFVVVPSLAKIADKSLNAFLITISVFVFTLSEYNLVVRKVLSWFHAEPENKDGSRNEKEYRAGRVIGFLERLLILTLFLSGNPSSVGFVIAAKGLIRFHELGDKNFAEYFLMGTLLSVAGALIASLFLKWIV